MRLATSSESEQVTTKTITNHNHLHALTMQYWEVQRLYDVRTEVNDLDFVCLVPMPDRRRPAHAAWTASHRR